MLHICEPPSASQRHKGTRETVPIDSQTQREWEPPTRHFTLVSCRPQRALEAAISVPKQAKTEKSILRTEVRLPAVNDLSSGAVTSARVERDLRLRDRTCTARHFAILVDFRAEKHEFSLFSQKRHDRRTPAVAPLIVLSAASARIECSTPELDPTWGS